MIAHELGHAKNQDVLLGTALAAVGAVGGVALLALLLDTRPAAAPLGHRGAADPAAVALLLALAALGGFAGQPAAEHRQPAIEARADRVSIRPPTTGRRSCGCSGSSR